MKVVSLLYHDAVVDGDFKGTGFEGADADLYKLDLDEMRQHFQAISEVRSDAPSLITSLLDGGDEKAGEAGDEAGDGEEGALPWALTFDDGGVTATNIADLLDEFGWKGHFLVTAGRVGTPEFLNEEQIRDLHERGHIVGTHSFSHPDRMSQFVRVEMIEEWRKSMELLSKITGEPVVVASIPRGDYSAEVAGTAGQCGIRAIFTSEPVKEGWPVGACLALGRYTLQRGGEPADSAGMVSSTTSKAQLRQYFWWNAKKAAKTLGGNTYLALRERILAARGRD